jgi:hypothetical protein
MRSIVRTCGNLILLVVTLQPGVPALASDKLENVKNSQAVEEVRSGKRTVANAAWWGFDEDDSTEALQAAIRSGAKTVVVPHMGMDWVVRPITLVGDLELVFEPGVVVSAKRGEFREGGDCVFSARDISNLTIQGAGAKVKMQKEDYIVGIVLKDLGMERWFGPYVKAEWRSVLNLRGCTNVKVSGLTLADSGGDGIYIDDGTDRKRCQKIELRDVICDNNYRQGLSIISVDGLIAENCTFKNTWGTPPSAGVDIEPDHADQVAKNIVFRNCRFEDNYGSGILVFLAPLEQKSDAVSIRFDDCYVTSHRGPGIRVTKIHDNGPAGSIEFHNCVVEGTEGYGIGVQDKSAQAARVVFANCVLRNVARNRGYRDIWVPILLKINDSARVARFGGIDLIDCRVEDNRNRPVLESSDNIHLNDIRGKIDVKNPHGARMALSGQQTDISLSVTAIPE